MKNNNPFGEKNIFFDMTHNKMYSRMGDNSIADMQSGNVHTIHEDLRKSEKE